MPPRKRARHSTASSPHPASSSKQGTASPTLLSPKASNADSDDERRAEVTARLLADPWTDAEETALFRAVIRHKPTGLHKHMSMLNIYTSLVSQGFPNDYPTPPLAASDNAEQTEDQVRHLSTRGIWKRLGELYDLDALDDREEAGDFERAFGLRHLEEDEEEDWADGSDQEVDDEDDPVHWGKEFRLPSTSSSRSASPSMSAILTSDGEQGGRRRSSIKQDQGGHASWSWLKWSKRFPSVSPSRSVSAVPGSSPAADSRRAGRRAKVERRDSSPPVHPDLVASKHNPPLDGFVPKAEQAARRKSSGRDTAKASAPGKKARVSTAASARSGAGTRRRGRASAAQEDDEDAEAADGDEASDRNDSGEGSEEDGSEEDGEEPAVDADEDEDEDNDNDDNDDDDDDEDEESSSAPEEPETPVKRKRGRPPGTVAGRGRGRGRGGGPAATTRRGGRR